MIRVLQREIDAAAETLRQGGVIAFPTDTVYGLGADAFNGAAVARIYDIKGRPRNNPLPLLIADIEGLAAVAGPMPAIARLLARRFWPGGLTLVLPKENSLPAHLATGPNIAVRVPDHPICLALIQRLGNPIIGTSANRSGQPSMLTADEVAQQLGAEIDFLVRGGRCPGGRQSTVVDVSGESPVILREGMIPSDEIRKTCQEYIALSEDRKGLPLSARPRTSDNPAQEDRISSTARLRTN
jgi:L-threonylcarbamoyladenylate synthase